GLLQRVGEQGRGAFLLVAGLGPAPDFQGHLPRGVGAGVDRLVKGDFLSPDGAGGRRQQDGRAEPTRSWVHGVLTGGGGGGAGAAPGAFAAHGPTIPPGRAPATGPVLRSAPHGPPRTAPRHVLAPRGAGAAARQQAAPRGRRPAADPGRLARGTRRL